MCLPLVSELSEGGVQVSVAELREGSDVCGGDQATHPYSSPGVSVPFSMAGASGSCCTSSVIFHTRLLGQYSFL